MDKQNMEYLGDGVYVGHDGFQVWITLNDHNNPELVALDPAVLEALFRYAQQHLGFKAP